ncbi:MULTISPECIES: hypothetical protein [Psychrilyobacter]|nr:MULTISPECIES: hypothetical protein [Psychrilyobacter]NDI78752.1 hypothetical protein [Psychrilyobacter piezotolerans]
MKISIINEYFKVLGFVSKLLQVTIPLLIYIYYDNKSSKNLDKFMIFYLLRCLLISAVPLIMPLNKNNFLLFIVLFNSIYYITTFLPYNLSFINDMKINSIKNSLLLTKKKIFVLISYDFWIILISTLVSLSMDEGLFNYIIVTNIFFNYEIKKYNIWKQEVKNEYSN